MPCLVGRGYSLVGDFCSRGLQKSLSLLCPVSLPKNLYRSVTLICVEVIVLWEGHSNARIVAAWRLIGKVIGKRWKGWSEFASAGRVSAGSLRELSRSVDGPEKKDFFWAFFGNDRSEYSAEANCYKLISSKNGKLPEAPGILKNTTIIALGAGYGCKSSTENDRLKAMWSEWFEKAGAAEFRYLSDFWWRGYLTNVISWKFTIKGVICHEKGWH
jgi:hypothetical protein